jgi:hypothetical protein
MRRLLYSYVLAFVTGTVVVLVVQGVWLLMTSCDELTS